LWKRSPIWARIGSHPFSNEPTFLPADLLLLRYHQTFDETQNLFVTGLRCCLDKRRPYKGSAAALTAKSSWGARSEA
jgi:hypothetical protein